MSVKNIDGGPQIPHDAARPLLPVDEHPGAITQHRPAALQLTDAPAARIARVVPTGFASSVFLTQHPLTSVEIEALHSATRQAIEDRADVDLGGVEYVQLGEAQRRPDDRSLTEF
jgi:hypothetical protein